MVAIARFDNFIEAHFAKSRLEAEGFHVFLQDQNTVSINPLEQIALGGIRLCVPSKQAKEAQRQWLQWQREARLQEDLRCPNCQSKYITRDVKVAHTWKARLAVFFSMLFATWPAHYQIKHRCEDCGQLFDGSAS